MLFRRKPIFYGRTVLLAVSAFLFITGCTENAAVVVEPSPGVIPQEITIPSEASSPTHSPTAESGESDQFTTEQVATLNSLQKVDDFPLYIMQYKGDYSDQRISFEEALIIIREDQIPTLPAWGCSLFTTLKSTDDMLFGRNFDWRYSPSLLLFTYPSDGYASVSMVDISYFIDENIVDKLENQPLSERIALLQAPYWPFDGMNERGLAIGMAAVPESRMPIDPNKRTIDSLMVMRRILDHAGNVEQALDIIDDYNIDWAEGPALHYLIADASGDAVLVEFVDGQMQLIPSQEDWHIATNFLRTLDPDNRSAGCWRFDSIQDRLAQDDEAIDMEQTIDLLSDVSWGNIENGTQWSVAYNMSIGNVSVVMGRNYDQVHKYQLEIPSD